MSITTWRTMKLRQAQERAAVAEGRRLRKVEHDFFEWKYQEAMRMSIGAKLQQETKESS